MELSVNGNTVQVDVEPDTPLLWVLRDELALTGTKFGCGQGLCGACTVHLGGVAIRSCITPVSAVQGQAVTTIEGLADGEQLHPLQESWIRHNVPQCGYCQSGQLMSAAALLQANPTPDSETIRSAMAGNICRCGTYPRIEAAIKDVVSDGQAAAALATEIKV